MQIFGKEVPSPEDIWQLYLCVQETPEIWLTSTFKDAASTCGLKKIAQRKSYFSFSGESNLTGQAPFADDFIEEIRLFIGQEPKDLSEELFRKDGKKHRQLAKSYVERFEEALGAPRSANGNEIFESDGFRLRVTSADCVWVVISSLEVVRQMGEDWWAVS